MKHPRILHFDAFTGGARAKSNSDAPPALMEAIGRLPSGCTKVTPEQYISVESRHYKLDTFEHWELSSVLGAIAKGRLPKEAEAYVVDPDNKLVFGAHPQEVHPLDLSDRGEDDLSPGALGKLLGGKQAWKVRTRARAVPRPLRGVEVDMSWAPEEGRAQITDLLGDMMQGMFSKAGAVGGVKVIKDVDDYFWVESKATARADGELRRQVEYKHFRCDGLTSLIHLLERLA